MSFSSQTTVLQRQQSLSTNQFYSDQWDPNQVRLQVLKMAVEKTSHASQAKSLEDEQHLSTVDIVETREETRERMSLEVLEKVASPGWENVCPKVRIAPLPTRLSMLLPPVNFGAVESGCIFRSAYPQPANYAFLSSLRINTVVTLVPEALPEQYMDYLIGGHIRHHQIHIPANKDGVISITPERMAQVLSIVLNRNNHPILIHCNRGKHRTGCVTACLRKVQSYPVDRAIAEYRDYASPKCRSDDEAFIASFDATAMTQFARKYSWPNTPPEPIESLCHGRMDSGALTFAEIANIRLPESLPDREEILDDTTNETIESKPEHSI